MPYCENCGSSLEPSAGFCAMCGKPRPDETTLPGNRRARLLAVLLACSALVAFIMIVSSFMEMTLLTRIHVGGSFTRSEALANDNRQKAFAGWFLLVFIATGVVWLFWQYQAHKNLEVLDAGTLKFKGAGNAIGWWLVPIANVVQPFRVMSELWSASNRGPEEKTPLLGWWWSAYLGSGLLGLASSFAGRAAQSAATNHAAADAIYRDYITRDVFMIISRVLLIAAAVAAVAVVKGIQRRQKQRLVRARAVEPVTPI